MRYLSVLSLALLAACGGGGGGGNGNTPSGDLQVTFSGYLQPGIATAYKAVSYPPTVSDLNGNRPAYRVASGSLPAGLSLDGRTGTVSGVFTAPGASSAQVQLTVDGFTGALSAPFAVTVNPVSLTYTGSAGSTAPIPATTFEVGAPLRAFSVYLLDPAVLSNGVYRLGPLQPASGVSIAYRVAASSALPAGLSLDANTGVISGVPSVLADVNTQVEALVSYAGETQTLAATIPFSIGAPTATLAYAPATVNGDLCVSLASASSGTAPGGGTIVTLTPVLTGLQPGDVVGDFKANSANLAGLSLDASTGVLSGIVFGNNCGFVVAQFDVSYTVTRGSYSSRLSKHIDLFQ